MEAPCLGTTIQAGGGYPEVTITDPEYYERPFTYKQTLARMKPGTELMEYVCMENNRWLERHYAEGLH
jgi:hypothetical protein